VVTGGDDVDIQLKEFFGQRGSDAETRGRVFPVGNDEIDGLIADNAGQFVLDDGASRTPEMSPMKRIRMGYAEVRW